MQLPMTLPSIQLFTLCLVLASTAAIADSSCVVPDVAVPIVDLQRTWGECLAGIQQRKAISFEAVDSLLSTQACTNTIRQAEKTSHQLDCIGGDLGFPSSLRNQALSLAPNTYEEDPDKSKCGASYSLLKKAAQKGDKLAWEYLFYVSLQGNFRHVCGPKDDQAAIQAMLDGAKAGSIALKLQLALTFLVSEYQPKFDDLDKTFSNRFSKFAAEAGRRIPRMSVDEILGVLNSAAGQQDSLGIHILIQIYQNGIVLPPRQDLALAWAALDEASQSNSSGSAEAQKTPFAFSSLYPKSDAVTKNSACSIIGQITRSNINFRFTKEDLKNEFALSCIDPNAIIASVNCLTADDISKLDRAIGPLLKDHSVCH